MVELAGGVILLNKPGGVTSRHCVNKLVRLLSCRKIGHAGTLDPGATGMLPIFVGRATKFIRFLVEQDKSYVVTMSLGEKTSTADNLGEVIATCGVPLLEEKRLLAVLEGFVGLQQQQVPLVSAVRVNGKRLYEYARQNQQVECPTRQVRINSIELIGFDGGAISLRVSCSKGTYVRSLVEDIGERLGSYAHVVKLHREWVEPFKNNCLSDFDEIDLYYDKHSSLDGYAGFLSLANVFSYCPSLQLTAKEKEILLHGKKLEYTGKIDVKSDWYALYVGLEFFGVASVVAGVLMPIKLLSLV